MSAINETCNRGHNILELIDILTNFSFATTETGHDSLKCSSLEIIIGRVRNGFWCDYCLVVVLFL